ncbi:MAG: PKD domain-containing protein, partial [Candidatus Latescibacterota bacterium]|nr:PKD domain-containing protein [Candidatus Latescibacterota bacterium]
MPLRLAALARAIRFPALAGLLIYCGAPPSPPAPNQVPLAAAGTDQQVALEEEVSVDGSLSSDPEGAALGFTWRAAVENPVAIVFPETLPRFSFVATVPGTYIFILSVSDGTLTSNPDSVRIAVASPDNQAPTADAGPDLIVGANSPIPLSGLGSNDPDGDPLSYQWTVLAAPMEIQLVDATTRQTTFTPTESGEYRFRLTVNDGELSASDQVAVLVHASGNQVPTADAGLDQQVAVGDLVILDGTLSAGLDSADGGAMILYHWIVGSVPGGTIALSDS